MKQKSEIKKILVPMDGSKNSKRGLNLALKIAKADSKIIGLYVVKSGLVSQKPQLKKQGQKILEDAAIQSKNAGINFSRKIRVGGSPGKEIVRFGQQNNVDLIIMGSRGPDSEFEIFLGSVSNYVVHKSKIPVTIVK